MICPQSMSSVDRFFDRDDPEKQFILEQIRKSEDPERTMQNYRKCLEIIWNGTFVANCENINVHVHLENFEEAKEKDVFNYFNVGSIEPTGIKSLTHKILPCDFSSENAAKDTGARILKTINSEVFQEYDRMADEYLSKQ